MSKERDSKKRIAFVQLFAEASSAAVPEEIHIVPTGKWDHPVYGEMEITAADITEFVQNFARNVRLDIPITAGHDNGMSGGELPAVGWFTELIDRGDAGLYGLTKWTEEGKQLLTDGSFKYFSPEFYEQYSDPETGVKYGHVLVGGALTNKPYFKELDPVATFSEPALMSEFDNQSMKLKDILAKKPNELSETEKTFLKEHKSELTTEQATAFSDVIGESAPAETEEEKTAREEKELGDANEAAGLNRDGSAKEVVASENGMVQISATELALLRGKADKGAEAFSQVETMKLDTEVAKMIFSEHNKDGRILPKSQKAVVTFMKSLSETQRDQFRNIVSSLPTSTMFAELGDGGKQIDASETAAAKLDAMAKEIVKASEGKMTYSAALSQATKENPKLASDYNAEMTSGEEA
ncbi:MAG: phage protease [Planctomycetota bacterium]